MPPVSDRYYHHRRGAQHDQLRHPNGYYAKDLARTSLWRLGAGVPMNMTALLLSRLRTAKPGRAKLRRFLIVCAVLPVVSYRQAGSGIRTSIPL
jgi:hypothetical protein